MNKFNKLTIVNAVIVVLLVTYIVFQTLQPKPQTTVYVDTIKLFNGFNMTADIKRIEEAKIKAKVKVLEDLYKTFNALSDKEKQLDVNKNLQQQIAYKSKDLQELQDALVQNLNKNVWGRLNRHLKTYAEAKKLTLILGKTNTGNVMYAKDAIDITDAVLEYANKVYEGE